jgi:hypothetical protein
MNIYQLVIMTGQEQTKILCLQGGLHSCYGIPGYDNVLSDRCLQMCRCGATHCCYIRGVENQVSIQTMKSEAY